LRSDYIHAAQADNVAVKDVLPLDANAADRLVNDLKATPFFKAAADHVRANPSFGSVIEQLESPFVLQVELGDLKSRLGGLQGKKRTLAESQITQKEQQLVASLAAAPGRAALLAESSNRVAARVAGYAQQFATLGSQTQETLLIHSLKDFTVKEVALATTLAGGNVLAYHQKHQLWQGLPRLIVILLGGFSVNFVWCVLLNIKNRTGYQYLASHVRPEHAVTTASAGEHAPTKSAGEAATAPSKTDLSIPRLANLLFCALAGSTWYFQFFFYSMGETQMGKFGFASWTLHMASIIIFSTLWGWILHEWKGSSKKAHLLIAGGIGTLILSTVVIGAGVGWEGLTAYIQSM
jgi:hypothetical protein